MGKKIASDDGENAGTENEAAQLLAKRLKLPRAKRKDLDPLGRKINEETGELL